MPQETPPLKVRIEQLKKSQTVCGQAIAIVAKSPIADGLDAWVWLKNLQANMAREIEILKAEIKSAKEAPDEPEENPNKGPGNDSVPVETEQTKAE